MATTSTAPADIRFDFAYYKFNGKGERPSMVPSVNEAHFMRCRQSIEGALIDLAKQRVETWSRERGIHTLMCRPYPSNITGKYWLEFRFGGQAARHEVVSEV